MADVPLDVIGDIFLSLPVKSLLRFRCISKHVRTLIDDLHFIKSHLDRSIKTKNNHNLILTLYSYYSVSFDSLDGADDPPFIIPELDSPAITPENSPLFWGFCHGLICMRIEDGNDHNAAIWNPTTRKCHILPDEPIECPDIAYEIFEFGYDSVHNQYKVVKIVHFTRSKQLDSEVRVFNLSTNSWKKTDKGFPSHFRFGPRTSVFACGALHWILHAENSISKDCNQLIVAFDLATEKHGFLPKPEFQGSPEEWYLGNFEGCFCVCLNYQAVCIDLWVMKDYGVKDSWSLFFTISNTYPEVSFTFALPLMYSKNGHKVLMKIDDNELVWYDVDQDTMEDIHIQNPLEVFDIDICVESLLPVNWGGEND